MSKKPVRKLIIWVPYAGWLEKNAEIVTEGKGDIEILIGQDGEGKILLRLCSYFFTVQQRV